MPARAQSRPETSVRRIGAAADHASLSGVPLASGEDDAQVSEREQTPFVLVALPRVERRRLTRARRVGPRAVAETADAHAGRHAAGEGARVVIGPLSGPYVRAASTPRVRREPSVREASLFRGDPELSASIGYARDFPVRGSPSGVCVAAPEPRRSAEARLRGRTRLPRMHGRGIDGAHALCVGWGTAARKAA